MTGLTTLLRRSGAVLLVAAGAVFMMQGWSSLTSLGRYSSFLAFSVVLTFFGVYCARRLHETKGARTFLSLGAATLVVHFSQLGALIYSVFAGSSRTLPGFLVYGNESPEAILGMLIAGLLLFLPIAWLAFRILCPSKAGVLSAAYLVGNLFLLPPLREASSSLLLIIGMGSLLTWLEITHFRATPEMQSTEGGVARLLLFAPLATLTGRSLLYPTNAAFVGSLLMLLGLASFYASLAWSRTRSRPSNVCQLLSIVPLAWGWCTLLGDTSFPIQGMSLALGLVALSRHGALQPWRLRQCASAIGLLAGMLGFTGPVDISLTAVSLVAGLALAAVGWSVRERYAVLSGAAILSLSLICHVKLALEYSRCGAWLSLGLAGTITLLGASLLESGRIRRAWWT